MFIGSDLKSVLIDDHVSNESKINSESEQVNESKKRSEKVTKVLATSGLKSLTDLGDLLKWKITRSFQMPD